jgi:DnaJ-class molecular chaperone
MGGMNMGQKPKPGPIRQHLKISLAELYTGKNVKITLSQQVLCGKCNGKGTSNPDGYKRCNICSGKGQVVHLRQVGPGMMQQIVQPCGNCNGKGKTVAKEDMCKQCDGKQVKVEEKEHFMNIKPGMDWGMGFHLDGKGHQQPDNDQQGDIEIQLAEISGYNPSNFKRQHNDLHMTHELSLIEALCGFNLMIYQLDERKIYVNHTKQNKIIQPNEVMKITGEGMPLLDNPEKKGDLYIHFEVKLPKALDEARKDVLLKVLPHPQNSKDEIKDFSRKVDLEEVKNQQQNHKNSNEQSQSNFNFEHEIPNPGVQCAQQ